jgi:hypothetical protein
LTTPSRGSTVGPPLPTIWACCAGTATATNTATVSSSLSPHPARSFGVRASVTPTPPGPNHPDQTRHARDQPTARRQRGRRTTLPAPARAASLDRRQRLASTQRAAADTSTTADYQTGQVPASPLWTAGPGP